MTVAIVGESRFPIYLSDDAREVIGINVGNRVPEEFKNYTLALSRARRCCIAIGTLKQPPLKRRFVIKWKAINPSLQDESDVMDLFVYPSMEAEKVTEGALCLGIPLRGVRNHLFLPMLVQRLLDSTEAEAFATFFKKPRAKSRDGTLDLMMEFAQALGIQTAGRKSLGERVAVTVTDPRVNGPYQVLMDTKGRVLETNVCFSTDDPVYLTEFIALTRQQRYLHIYPKRW